MTRRPVLLVVLDELPLASLLDEGDRIDPEQFPNLARLAEDATWYRNTTGVSPTTPEAVPPDPDRSLPRRRRPPADRGGASRQHLHLAAGHLRPPCPGVGDPLCPAHCARQGSLAPGTRSPSSTLDALDLWQRQLFGGGDDRQVDFAIRQSDPDAPTTINEFAEGIDGGRRARALDVLHTVYPHQPWYHLPSGLTYEAPFIAEGLDQYAQYAWIRPTSPPTPAASAICSRPATPT